jgi:hypothetical protein
LTLSSFLGSFKQLELIGRHKWSGGSAGHLPVGEFFMGRGW